MVSFLADLLTLTFESLRTCFTLTLCLISTPAYDATRIYLPGLTVFGIFRIAYPWALVLTLQVFLLSLIVTISFAPTGFPPLFITRILNEDPSQQYMLTFFDSANLETTLTVTVHSSAVAGFLRTNLCSPMLKSSSTGFSSPFFPVVIVYVLPSKITATAVSLSGVPSPLKNFASTVRSVLNDILTSSGAIMVLFTINELRISVPLQMVRITQFPGAIPVNVTLPSSTTPEAITFPPFSMIT